MLTKEQRDAHAATIAANKTDFDNAIETVLNSHSETSCFWLSILDNKHHPQIHLKVLPKDVQEWCAARQRAVYPDARTLRAFYATKGGANVRFRTEQDAVLFAKELSAFLARNTKTA